MISIKWIYFVAILLYLTNEMHFAPLVEEDVVPQSMLNCESYDQLIHDLRENWQSPISYLKKRGYLPRESEAYEPKDIHTDSEKEGTCNVPISDTVESSDTCLKPNKKRQKSNAQLKVYTVDSPEIIALIKDATLKTNLTAITNKILDSYEFNKEKIDSKIDNITKDDGSLPFPDVNDGLIKTNLELSKASSDPRYETKQDVLQKALPVLTEHAKVRTNTKELVSRHENNKETTAKLSSKNAGSNQTNNTLQKDGFFNNIKNRVVDFITGQQPQLTAEIVNSSDTKESNVFNRIMENFEKKNDANDNRLESSEHHIYYDFNDFL